MSFNLSWTIYYLQLCGRVIRAETHLLPDPKNMSTDDAGTTHRRQYFRMAITFDQILHNFLNTHYLEGTATLRSTALGKFHMMLSPSRVLLGGLGSLGDNKRKCVAEVGNDVRNVLDPDRDLQYHMTQ